jgi:hypothetical protein
MALAVAFAAVATAADIRLANAMQIDDLVTVRSLLVQKVDVDVAQVDGSTPLLWAAHNGNKEAVELLLKASATPRTANRYGIFPLSEAALNGHAAIKLLLDAGADSNATLPEGDTPLMIASRVGRVDAVKVLMDQGAQPNAKKGVARRDGPDVGRRAKPRRGRAGADRTWSRPQCPGDPPDLAGNEEGAGPGDVGLSRRWADGLDGGRPGGLDRGRAGTVEGRGEDRYQKSERLTVANAHFDLANLLLHMLDMAGVPTESIGDSTGTLDV